MTILTMEHPYFRVHILFWAFLACAMGNSLGSNAAEPNIVYMTEDGSVYKDTLNVDILSKNMSINVTTTTIDISSTDTFSLQRLLCQLVSTGTVAFASTISCEKMNFIASVLSLMKIPLVNIGERCMESEDYNNVIEYFHNKAHFNLVLSDVMQIINWKDFFVLYDHNSVQYLNDINEILIQQNGTSQTFKMTDISQDVSDILKYVQYQQGVITKFIILCGKDCVLEVLSQANSYEIYNDVQGLFTYKAQWLIILQNNSDLMAIQDAVQGLDHVTVVMATEEQTKNTFDILQNVENLIASTLMVFDDDAMNITDKTYYNSSTCAEKLSISHNIYNSFQDYFSGGPCMNCTEYVVMSAFYLPGRKRRFQIVGEWTRQEYKVHGQVFPNLAFGFNQRNFLTDTLEWDPFVRINKNTSTGFEGLCIALLQELAINLNFTYNVTTPADGQWGDQVNGSWTGLVGDLERKVVDMTVAPLGIDVDRAEVMDFTEAFFLEYQTVLVRYKSSESEKWRLYVEPFQWESWLSFLAAIPLGAFAIWIVTKMTPYYAYHGVESEKKAKEGLGKLENALFFSFGAFFQQGSIWLPDSQSGRFIVGFWWMYCIVVVATYSGNLIAYLTVTKTALPFDTVSDMLAQDKFQFGTLGGTLTAHRFRNAKDGTDDRAIWTKISEWANNDPSILSTDHAYHIDRVVTENYAYIQDRTSFELVTSKRCDIGIISDNFQPFEYAIGLQNNSYFEEQISLEVIKIRETGLLNRWKVDWWPRQSFCSTGTQTVAKAVSLTDVQGAYYVMGILLALALIALLSETILHVTKSRKMTGKHSGGHQKDSHTIQMETKNGEAKPIPIEQWDGFDSIIGQTRINKYGGMFETNGTATTITTLK